MARFLFILLLIISSVPRYCFEESQTTTSSTGQPSTKSILQTTVSFDLAAVSSLISTLIVCAACLSILNVDRPSYIGSEKWYAICIASTPPVHALDLLFRTLCHRDGVSGLPFTISEALREIFSASAAVSFLTILESQLKRSYGADTKLPAVLVNKKFQFHYPFGIKKPVEFKMSTIHLFLFRACCYQTFVFTLILYGGRLWLEIRGEWGETYGYCFQVLYLFTSSLGVSAVHAYAEVVDEEIRNHRMAQKIGQFEILMLLLWFEGPGVALLHSAHGFCIMSTLIGYCAKGILDMY